MGFGNLRLDEPASQGEKIILSGHQFSALLHWKPRRGEAVTVSDPLKRLFRARIENIGEDHAEIVIFEESGATGQEPEILLLQAMPQKERMELTIQKTAELGVSKICPLRSLRSITPDERDTKQRKSHKWQDIALKASKQSRRRDIPEVLSFRDLSSALELAKGFDVKLALWEAAGLPLIKDYLSGLKGKDIKSAAILVGPEGGFTGEEIALAAGAGFIAVSLGARILRTETAAIFGVGILRYELGG